MNLNKFATLIEELNTGLIVFIDDDFVPIESSTEILNHIIFLNDVDYNLSIAKINQINNELPKLIEDFKNSFLALNISEDEQQWIDAGEPLVILTNRNEAALLDLGNRICGLINNHIKEMATIAMNYGLIAANGGVACYKPFFETAKSNKSLSTRIYKNLEGNLFNEFEEDAIASLERLENKYCLLIVDKVLNTQDGNAIISQLRDNNRIKRFFSVLFTSQLAAAANQVGISQYFHLEIPKPADGISAINQVSEGLALCAYAKFFAQLYELKKNALDKANSLVIDSGKENILYLADMAHSEGAIAFRTIDSWFELLIQKKLHDELSQANDGILNFDFIIGLTSLIKSHYFSNNTGNIAPAFHDELQQLNCFELFNNSINDFYLPPTPGDIYEIDGNLYILTGQDCDLIVRDNMSVVSRKEKLAEMVACKFDPNPLDDKKKEDEKSITLNFFYYNGSYGSIKIELNKRVFFDFRVLDLCSTNKNGLSELPEDKKALNKKALKALPAMWGKYIPRLYDELLAKIKIHNFIAEQEIPEEILSADKSYSLVVANTDGKYIYPIKRVSRLKGQFKDYFLQKYWEYKTRKGLNTISLYNKQPIAIGLKCGFGFDLLDVAEQPHAWIQLTGNREKNKSLNNLALIVEKESILSKLAEPYKTAFNRIGADEFIIDKRDFDEQISSISFKKEYIEESNLISLEISFPYYNELTNEYFKPKRNMSLKQLFNSEFLGGYNIPTDAHYTIDGEDGQMPLYHNGSLVRIDIVNIQRGLRIPSVNLNFKLDNTTGKLIALN